MARPLAEGSAGEVFAAFLRLGLTSFGGPAAHLGYFRAEFVQRRRWLDDAAFADLVALCQFLPGPGSSQTGFAIGLRRAGWRGALAAWTGFTLPSALLMFAAAAGIGLLHSPVAVGVLHGLKLAAVAVVAQAVVGMARSLAPDVPRAAIALAALTLVLLAGASAGQLLAIGVGGIAGLLLCRVPASSVAAGTGWAVPRGIALVALAAFAGLLIGLPLVAAATGTAPVAGFAAFYRAGALVFGGGHVVLPLLQAGVVAPGWVTPDAFLAGYGAAQALPGPLFTIATYLGALMRPGGVAGAALATVAIFLPGLLLLVAALPFWGRVSAAPRAQAALRGASAAVVGVLAAALYDPVWTGSVGSLLDVGVAAAAFAALVAARAPPVAVVAACAVAGLVTALN